MTDIKTPKDNIILVPMDFSDSSMNAVYYGVEMANFFDSEITLLHVLSNSMLSNIFTNDSQIALLRDSVRAKLEEVKADILVKWPNVRVNTKVEEGKPFKVINKVAKDGKVDTIVMGTNGANGVEQFTGSTTTRVLKSSPIPVIVVKEKRTSPKFDKIVLPIDLTKTSKQKIDWAVKLGKKYDSTIHIIMELESDELIEKKVNANLNQAETIFTRHGMKFESHLLDDMQYPDHLGMDAIKYAEEIDADLIMIMTKSESSKLTDLFVGSFAEQVVNSSQKTPVMCINPKPTGALATGGSGFY
ncbi:universal stress protein [Bacteroidia bacterium]|nr:universal stress protein [Bacteroidia bacterium]MDC1395690.1 universal stress protein [Bacteroidia bacterium]